MFKAVKLGRVTTCPCRVTYLYADIPNLYETDVTLPYQIQCAESGVIHAASADRVNHPNQRIVERNRSAAVSNLSTPENISQPL